MVRCAGAAAHIVYNLLIGRPLLIIASSMHQVGVPQLRMVITCEICLFLPISSPPFVFVFFFFLLLSVSLSLFLSVLFLFIARVLGYLSLDRSHFYASPLLCKQKKSVERAVRALSFFVPGKMELHQAAVKLWRSCQRHTAPSSASAGTGTGTPRTGTGTGTFTPRTGIGTGTGTPGSSAAGVAAAAPARPLTESSYVSAASLTAAAALEADRSRVGPRRNASSRSLNGVISSPFLSEYVSCYPDLNRFTTAPRERERRKEGKPSRSVLGPQSPFFSKEKRSQPRACLFFETWKR